jgi:hypothetical protein
VRPAQSTVSPTRISPLVELPAMVSLFARTILALAGIAATLRVVYLLQTSPYPTSMEASLALRRRSALVATKEAARSGHGIAWLSPAEKPAPIALVYPLALSVRAITNC